MIINFPNALFHNIKFLKFFLNIFPSTTVLQTEYVTNLTAPTSLPVVGSIIVSTYNGGYIHPFGFQCTV